MRKVTQEKRAKLSTTQRRPVLLNTDLCKRSHQKRVLNGISSYISKIVEEEAPGQIPRTGIPTKQLYTVQESL